MASCPEITMSVEKTRAQLSDEAHLKSHLGPERPIPKSAKYRSNGSDEKADTKFSGASIGQGSRIIMRETRRGAKSEVIGYMLGTVIDAENISGFWTADTEFIVEIIDVSNDALKEHLGHLRSVTASSWGWIKTRNIVAIGKETWDDYKPSGNKPA